MIWSIYQIHDDAGKVVYVGITTNLKLRQHGHRRTGLLPRNGVLVEVAQSKNKGCAYMAEARMIAELSPVYNIRSSQAARFSFPADRQVSLELARAERDAEPWRKAMREIDAFLALPEDQRGPLAHCVADALAAEAFRA